MTTLKLYDLTRSGNCYKVRLLLSMLSIAYQRVPTDIAKGETRTPEFLHLNPRGQLPVLSDGDTVIWDSMAILVYLARRYGSEQWLPTDALGEARVMQWLAVSENEILYGLARARAALHFKLPCDLKQCQIDAQQGLRVLEQQLSGQPWLAASHATIADLACYPYVALADEAQVSLAPYPAVQVWLERMAGLPGWIPMAD